MRSAVISQFFLLKQMDGACIFICHSNVIQVDGHVTAGRPTTRTLRFHRIVALFGCSISICVRFDSLSNGCCHRFRSEHYRNEYYSTFGRAKKREFKCTTECASFVALRCNWTPASNFRQRLSDSPDPIWPLRPHLARPVSNTSPHQRCAYYPTGTMTA